MHQKEALKYKDPGEEGRKGLWIYTYTGKRFFAFDPRPEEIDIEDIAHALALTCRYSGHCNRFFSVAQHSVLVSQCVPDSDAPWGLMHDAAEAYITDIPRPIKHSLPNYKELEGNINKCIAEKFGLPKEIPESVHTVDHNIVCDEANVLFNNTPSWAEWYTEVGVEVIPLDWQDAKEQFIERYKELFLKDRFPPI